MRGRPVLGAISGLFFGLFLAVLLQQLGIWPLDNLAFFGLPGLGLVLGLLMAWWAPFGGSAAPTPAPARTAPPSRPMPPPSTPPGPPSGPPPPPGQGS